jgi:hypothetical protein
MVPSVDLDDFSLSDLKSLVLKLFEEVGELRRIVAAQRDQIARLKGGPGRPNIKPSGMDKGTEPKGSPLAGGEPRRKGSKTSKLSIDEERTVKVAAPPRGSRFKALMVCNWGGFLSIDHVNAHCSDLSHPDYEAFLRADEGLPSD